VISWVLPPGAAASAPSGAGYDVVLLGHIAAVLVGTLTLVVSGAQGARLRALGPRAPVPASLAAYYRPGTNWAGRVLYLIPVLGLALLGMSHGAYGLGDGWVLAGLVIFVAVAFGAEGLLWPAEQRLRHSVTGPELDGPSERAHLATRLRRDSLVVVATSAVLVALVVVACVLMVAKP
jgi:hypothetical protein